MAKKKSLFQPVKIGLAIGILWSVTVFITTIYSMWTNYAPDFLNIFSQMYPGHSVSLLGASIGAVYGFVDLFIMGFIFAWLYNKLTK
ncbi:MAG: bacteriophage holin [archaeon]